MPSSDAASFQLRSSSRRSEPLMPTSVGRSHRDQATCTERRIGERLRGARVGPRCGAIPCDAPVILCAKVCGSTLSDVARLGWGVSGVLAVGPTGQGATTGAVRVVVGYRCHEFGRHGPRRRRGFCLGQGEPFLDRRIGGAGSPHRALRTPHRSSGIGESHRGDAERSTSPIPSVAR
jgi:hypothetical protein